MKKLILLTQIVVILTLSLFMFNIGEMWGWVKGAEQTATYCMLQNMTIK